MNEGRVAKDGLDLALNSSEIAATWGSKVRVMLGSTLILGRLGTTRSATQLKEALRQNNFDVDLRRGRGAFQD